MDAGGSVNVSSDASANNSDAENAYWEQAIEPTSENVTVSAWYMEDLVMYKQYSTRDVKAHIDVWDSGTGDWVNVLAYENTTIADDTHISPWKQLGPTDYDPSDQVENIRVHIDIQLTSGGNRYGHDNIWMDNVSVSLPSKYRENVEHRISGIPQRDNYELQTEYKIAGDASENIIVYLENFTSGGWDNIDNLGSTSLDNLAYNLTNFENDYLENDGGGGDNVHVRFVQPDNDPTQTILRIDYTRVLAFNTAEWSQVESWSGTVSAPAVGWQSVETWSGTIKAPAAGWQRVGSWTGTVSAPSSGWSRVGSWTGPVSAPAAGWQRVGSWTGTVSAPSSGWSRVGSWTGPVSAPAPSVSWTCVESWSGHLPVPVRGRESAVLVWKMTESWMGTLQAPVEPRWTTFESWIGVFQAQEVKGGEAEPPLPTPRGRLPRSVLLYSTLISIGSIGGGFALYWRFFRRIKPRISLQRLADQRPRIIFSPEGLEPKFSLMELIPVPITQPPAVLEGPFEPIPVTPAPAEPERGELMTTNLSTRELLERMKELPGRKRPRVPLSRLKEAGRPYTTNISLDVLRRVIGAPKADNRSDGRRGHHLGSSTELERLTKDLRHDKLEMDRHGEKFVRDEEMKREIIQQLKELGERVEKTEKVWRADYEEILDGTIEESKDLIERLEEPDYARLSRLEQDRKNRASLKKWLIKKWAGSKFRRQN